VGETMWGLPFPGDPEWRFCSCTGAHGHERRFVIDDQEE
jgi:hypothetical protein